jgi:1-acyl-sn-glycerol-3-phosphate acyltransferase
MSTPTSFRSKFQRRIVSVPALFGATVLLTSTIPIWLPVSVAVDAIRLRFRFPIARLLAFGVGWCWIESAGVARAFVLWCTGRAGDHAAQYHLMGWWAGALMRHLSTTIGISPRVIGVDQVAAGDAIVLSRHVSLADSLLSGWALRTIAGVHPRYVLKRELLFDPCLDIVGLRVPNHFLDREATDGSVELDALRDLASGVGPGVVAVIFAEGTRSNDRKRIRAIEKIAERDPERAERMSALHHLLPPRPAGSIALIEGAPTADIVLAWHTGFDGLDSFGGIVERLARPLPPVQFVLRRVPRGEVPGGAGFVAWLDEQWLQMDAEVASALALVP